MRLAEGLQLKVYELFGYEAGLTLTEINTSTLLTVHHGQTGFGAVLREARG